MPRSGGASQGAGRTCIHGRAREPDCALGVPRPQHRGAGRRAVADERRGRSAMNVRCTPSHCSRRAASRARAFPPPQGSRDPHWCEGRRRTVHASWRGRQSRVLARLADLGLESAVRRSLHPVSDARRDHSVEAGVPTAQRRADPPSDGALRVVLPAGIRPGRPAGRAPIVAVAGDEHLSGSIDGRRPPAASRVRRHFARQACQARALRQRSSAGPLEPPRRPGIERLEGDRGACERLRGRDGECDGNPVPLDRSQHVAAHGAAQQPGSQLVRSGLHRSLAPRPP